MSIRPFLYGFIILGVVAPIGLVAQDAPGPATENEPEVRTTAILNEQTLGRDIETAGFYELIAWLEGLNQSTTGDRDALRRRVLDYYGLTTEEPGAEDERTPLVVDSAARTRYFTLDEIDERYVRLSGGVTLTLRDDERDVTHQIVADEVTYNQDLNILSASGDVIYTLDRGGAIEQFTGAALTVQLDDWEGAFVQGVTERARTIEGEQVDFSFAGSYITRSSDDVVVMEDGRVTSSTADPPNYEIRADKIWVLSPGEWGLRNAHLYVGRVAVFYFPFFFRPGNELFFNPSVGVRDREGRFIQTTTYILGEPEEPESAFSFLQIAEEEGTTGAQKIEGLYLVPDEAADLAPPDSGAVLRILTDIYTKLGAYVAIDGEFPEAGALNNLEVYLGLGMSRQIYTYNFSGGGTTTYSPYYLTGDEAIPVWNATQIG
ncbi:MAG: LPS-assembly protein LptD, partial [Spirochaetaceae bacterium]|nr:LPS-assembly protein LptD [Spirochaetaceae bacterium]